MEHLGSAIAFLGASEAIFRPITDKLNSMRPGNPPEGT